MTFRIILHKSQMPFPTKIWSVAGIIQNICFRTVGCWDGNLKSISTTLGNTISSTSRSCLSLNLGDSLICLCTVVLIVFGGIWNLLFWSQEERGWSLILFLGPQRVSTSHICQQTECSDTSWFGGSLISGKIHLLNLNVVSLIRLGGSPWCLKAADDSIIEVGTRPQSNTAGLWLALVLLTRGVRVKCLWDKKAKPNVSGHL